MFKVLAASFLLLLTACGGGSGCTEKVWTGEIGVCLHEGWEQVPSEQLKQEGVPEETHAVFQLSEKRAGQRDNIVVTKERVSEKVSAVKFAEANMRVVEQTAEFAEIEKKEVKVAGQDTFMHVFTARPVPDLPARRFYQVSIIKGKTGYVFTGTLPFSTEESVEEDLVSMLMSATLEEE